MDIKTEPPAVALTFETSSCIDVGVQEFSGINSILVYIRPKDIERTKHLNGAGSLETRAFEDIEVNELRDLFLRQLSEGEEFRFKFETPSPSYGYIFPLKLKHRIYGIVRGIEE